jgi:aminoglycoside 6-adenylyltransferase
MRSSEQMRQMILDHAKKDERTRAVIMNGSRANPNARPDPLQDFDIVYIVSDVEAFRRDRQWIERFGDLMILQMPDDMQETPPGEGTPFSVLMQFADGNRLDLRIYPAAMLGEMPRDSLSVLLLDKNGVLGAIAPANESDYLPRPPSRKAFVDCCNEFWWVCPYVAKGLWRGESTYAKSMLDSAARDELMKMLVWYVGFRHDFMANPGFLGKNLRLHLEPELWDLLLDTYADADEENNWRALFTMCDLFGRVAGAVSDEFGFDYPGADATRVRAYLEHVRHLPHNARAIY